MQALEKVLNWLLVSSNDPQEVSLTVKGLLISAVPTIMFVTGLAHLNLGSDTITNIFDGAANLVQALLTVIGVAATLYGAVRKAWLTMFPAAVASTQQ